MLGRFAMELSTSESITMIYCRFTLKPNKRSLCSEVCMLGEITTKEQINKLTHEQHIAYSQLAIAHLHNVDWNSYNKAKRQSKASDYENFLQLAPTPSPYRSWPEFHMFNNTIFRSTKLKLEIKLKSLLLPDYL
tara:strand:+ start:921 stop:1322 length:402 start_codon:yes stop_codon:yes gene_type:complete